MPPTPHDLSGANPALLLSRDRCTVAWVSGAYREPLTFHDPNIVWVSLVIQNREKRAAARLGLVTLN